nr:M polypeptide of photosystem I [Streptofilum capillatum]WKT08597.1 M polypeptide of photosystem I [Streptofilum capillatum]WKT08696.1 M polypeptide of photosystem I [Streptofilum sp. BC4-VF8pt]WKT08795.1 M polypeptide of photosystem I [Streptofilum sp. ZNP2-VF4pt]
MSISDNQIFLALVIALFTGVLALRLGKALYNS